VDRGSLSPAIVAYRRRKLSLYIGQMLLIDFLRGEVAAVTIPGQLTISRYQPNCLPEDGASPFWRVAGSIEARESPLTTKLYELAG
jgi:hypothetical protein